MSSSIRNIEKHSSIQKQVRDLRQQTGDLASVMQYAMGEVQKVNQRLGQITAVLNGVVELLGQEDVEAVVKAQQDAIAKDQAAKAKESLTRAVEEKKVLVEDVITEDSIVEAVEYDEKGVPISPGYFQFPFTSLIPALRDKWLGKKKGEKVETANDGHTAEVLGIYKPNPEPPKEESPPVDPGVAPSPVETATPATENGGQSSSSDEESEADPDEE